MIEAEIDKLKDQNITIPAVTFVNPTLKKLITDFSAAGLDAIDFTQFDNQVRIVSLWLTSYYCCIKCTQKFYWMSLLNSQLGYVHLDIAFVKFFCDKTWKFFQLSDILDTLYMPFQIF